jgi:4-amino-4-deoxy-L-arabinose transferase-like glycosyltransferase
VPRDIGAMGVMSFASRLKRVVPFNSRPNIRHLLTCVWLLFVVRGLFYISFVPLWEGLDEWAHYAVVQIVATRGSLLVSRNDRVSRAIQTSLETAPWVDGVRQDSYWRLSDLDRSGREERLRSMPPEWAREPAADGALAYEAQQAPLYYWLFALAYKAIGGLSFLTQIWILRLLGLLIASAVIPLGFLVAKHAFQNNFAALGIVALIAATPELMLTVSHVGNDSLAVAMGSLLLFALFEWKEEPGSFLRGLALGTVLGFALLTKAYFLALVPPVFVLVAIRATRRGVYRQAFFLLASTVVISAWWYAHTWKLTHSISGEQIEVGGVAGVIPASAAFRTNWLSAINVAFVSHTWLGNWSFLVVRSWMYRFFAFVVGLAGIGLILRFASKRNQLPSRPDLILLLSCYVAFLLALGYHAFRTFQVQQSAATLAHYLVALAVSEAILMVAGLEAVMPAALSAAVIPGGVISLAALEFFGTHFYAIPYYTGFNAHLSNGGLPALKIQQLQHGGFHLMLARLAINKPAFLNAAEIEILWILFLAATSGLIILSLRFAWLAQRSDPLASGRSAAPHSRDSKTLWPVEE